MMFGLFKKKDSGLPLMEKKIPMPEVKEPRFLTRDEANKISQDFVDSGKYDEGTLKLIKYIENGINYNASRGFKKYEYGDDGGFSFIKYNFNEDLLKNHFKELGYSIYTYNGGVDSFGVYYLIKISWE